MIMIKFGSLGSLRLVPGTVGGLSLVRWCLVRVGYPWARTRSIRPAEDGPSVISVATIVFC